VRMEDRIACMLLPLLTSDVYTSLSVFIGLFCRSLLICV